jgi:hypothetical protein
MLYYFYRIVCKDLEIKDCYVGSSNNLVRRILEHMYTCESNKSKSYNLKIYQFIRNNGGWKNWRVILIEKLEFNNKIECLQNERKLIEFYKSNLNSIIPSRTPKEYYIQYNIKKKDKKKEYYIKNKEKIKEQNKEYRIENADKIKEYYIKNKGKIKEYRINNADELKQKKKVYYLKKKQEKIEKQLSEITI